MDPTLGVVIGTVGAQLLTAFTLMYNARKARQARDRLRAEDLEDRATARRIELEDRAALATKVEQSRQELISKVDQTAGQLHKAIAENTEETKLAGVKADRISDMNQRLLGEMNKDRSH